jgi:hypothetical protein
MPSAPALEKPLDAQRGQFLALLSKSLSADTFVKLVLA